MSICETDIVLITKTTFKRVNKALLVNDVCFFTGVSKLMVLTSNALFTLVNVVFVIRMSISNS